MLRTAVLPGTSGAKTAPRGACSNTAEPIRSRWKCSACTVWNSELNVNCTTCTTSRSGNTINLKQEQKEMRQVTVVNPSISHRVRALFSKAPPQWTCPVCTFVNRGIFSQCQSCWYLRAEVSNSLVDSSNKDSSNTQQKSVVKYEDSSPGVPSVFDSIKALFGRSSSNAAHSKSAAGDSGGVQKVKEEECIEEEREGERKGEEENGVESGEGRWKCQQCTFLNHDSQQKCSLCDLPKDFEIPLGQQPLSPSQDADGQSDTASRVALLRGPLQLEPDLDLKEASANTFPYVQADIPTSLQERHHSFTSSHGAPTWHCQVCGTFNVVTSGLQQCFLCGIGVIPERYLPLLQGRESSSSTVHTLPPLPEQPSPHHQPQAQLEVVPQLLEESNSQDYVNLPQLALTNQHPEGPSNHVSSPSHPLTHVNQLQASSSLSPLHITSSNGRVLPQSELSHVNSFLLRPSPSPQHSLGSSYYRDVPLWEQDQLSQLHCAQLRTGHFLAVSPASESFLDPYLRPRTPPGFLKSQSLQEPHKQGAQCAELGSSSSSSSRSEQEQNSTHKPGARCGELGGRRSAHSTHKPGARCAELGGSSTSSSGCYNRTKCLQARREEDVLQANAVYLEIERYCRMSREPFTDPDFPPADKSLYTSPTRPVERWQVGTWERPVGLRDDFDSEGIEWTVLREPRPEDIAQGVLGNCWFLSALGVIAEQPQLIEDILVTKQYCPGVGAYQVRLCRDGKWEVVVIDDCFPCLETGELVFSKAHRKQLWVPLIEKALAKLYGSYEALNAGRVLLGLSVLTGLPCEKIHLKRPSLKGEAVDTDLIWARLLSFRERGFPMSASCGGEGWEEEESVYTMLGLESNHAYSILDVRQLGSEQLIRLRNPWGKFSWKGSWSDQDPRWQSQPWLREELQAVGGDAGVFWMSVHDFFQYFCEVDVCKYRPNWHSLRCEGKLLPFAAPRIETLAFQVTTTTEVDISIYQPSSRGRGNGHNLVDMAVLVLCYSEETPHSLLPTSCSLESGSHIQSIVTTSGFLSPGRYLILPLSFNHYRHATKKLGATHPTVSVEGDQREENGNGNGVPYVMAVFSAQELAYENVSTRPGFLPESLMLLAEKTGKVTESFPNMLLYEVYMKHSCRYVVAVNLDKHLHFTVACDGTESVNVTCSRGELYSEDCIPPRHRQILWVLTQLEGTSRYSVLMNITSTCTDLNRSRQWGAQHFPPLTSTTAELHAPRFIN